MEIEIRKTTELQVSHLEKIKETLFDVRKSIKEKLKKCLWNLLYLSLSMKLKKLKVMAVKQNDESVVPKENDKEETEYIAM